MSIVMTIDGQRVTLEPPQRVLLLQFRRMSTGDEVTILHRSATTADGELLTSQPTSRPAGLHLRQSMQPSGIPREYLGLFPPISTLDVSNLPTTYTRVAAHQSRPFTFVLGESYAVALVSEWIVEATVVAR